MAREPSFDERVRELVIRDILSLALPLFTLLGGLGVVLGVLSWSENPLRLLVGALALTCCGVAWALRAVGRPPAAVAMLVVALALGAATAMLFNGGLRAPASALLLVLVAMTGWAWGRRASLASAAGAAAFSFVVSALLARGVLHEASPPPPLVHAGFFALDVALIFIVTAVPQRRPHAALTDALRSEEAARLEFEKRRRAELAFRALFEQSPRFMALVDERGLVLGANAAALQFLRLESDAALLQRPLPSLEGWSAGARVALVDALQRATSGGVQRFETPGPKDAVLEFTLTPLLDEQQVRSIVVEGRDLSATLVAQKREQQARRLEVLGQLAGGVAHDFNNLLAVMLSSGQVLEEDLRAAGVWTGEVKESVETISAMGLRASDLTRRLLNFSRHSPLELKPVSLADFLSSCVKLLQRTLPANIRITRVLGAARDRVRVDPALLESAVLNLAINARDAMPGGGTLSLETATLPGDGAVRLSVRDTGTGLAPEVREHLFEPFFSTKGEGQGTGLGLASVQATMQAHGGVVSVETEPGRGTVFHLDFPPAPEVREKTPPAPLQVRFPGLRALVVDDDENLRRLTPRLLSSLGIESQVAADAESALPLFQEAPDAFDVAVLDVVLPGRQGHELALDLVRANEKLKVVLVSGFPRDPDLAALPAGRVRMLRKPFSLDGLRATLSALES
jgi:signal transduction histidine kinase